MNKYTHQIVYMNGINKTTVQVSHHELLARVLKQYESLRDACETVTIQKYPLEDNKIVIIKE